MRILLFSLLVLPLVSCYRANEKQLEWNHIANSKITEFQPNVDNSVENTLILSAQTESFKLKIFERQINEEQFAAFAKNVLDMLASYYKEFESPYPGTVSEKIVCTDAVKPRRLASANTENMIVEGALLYANSRYAHGDCDPKDLTQEALHALVHCKKSKLTYEVKYFIQKSDTSSDTLKAVFTDFKCI